MALVVGAVEPCARHRDGLAAVKGGVFAHSPGIQRGGAGDELEHAARLVQVADGFVAPLGLLGQLQGGSALAAGKGIHGLAGGCIVDHARLVRVVGGRGGHGQHGPGVHVHHDAHGARRHMMLLDRIIQRVFKVMLDVGIDSQPQAAAFQGHFFGLVALLQCVAPSVDGGEHHTILPGEHIVIFQLQPAHTGVVYIGKAQHAGQKFPLRVPALGVLIDADAGDAVLFTKIPHAVGGVALHAVAQKAVVGGAVTEFFQQLRFVQLQYFRKALRGKAELFLRHLARGGPQCPAAAVGGKQYTVGAVDTAPVGRHHSIAQLLAEGTARIPVA